MSPSSYQGVNRTFTSVLYAGGAKGSIGFSSIGPAKPIVAPGGSLMTWCGCLGSRVPIR
jgi:hypothetical protein